MTTRRSLLFNLKLRAMQAREAGLEMLWVEVSEVETLVNPELSTYTVDGTPEGTGQIVSVGVEHTERHEYPKVRIAGPEAFVQMLDCDEATQEYNNAIDLD